MTKFNYSKIGFLLVATLLGTLAGCASDAGGPPPGTQVDAGFDEQDDYVYYPGYQVYYGSSRHQYVYRDGHSWVRRPTPPHVSAQAVLASPSVKLDFHDSPAIHHATVVKQYPKNWAPPKSGPTGNDRR